MPIHSSIAQSGRRRQVGLATPLAERTLALYVEREDNQNRPFGEQTQMFRELTEMGVEQGVSVVVLSPGYLARRKGWTFDKRRNVWQEIDCPNLDVVVRRSGTFHQTSLANVTRDLQWFQQAGRLHTLPRLCGNKWLLYQALKDVDAVRTVLPETARATTPADLSSYVRKWKDVYVKPLNGAQGISIYRLQLAGDQVVAGWQRRLVPRQTERLSNQFRPDTAIESARFRDESAFRQFCEKVMPKTCLVQRTVQLPTTNEGNPFDFRWLVQFHPNPEVVARVARVGQVGAVTTNIHTGGKALDATQLLSTLQGRRAEDSLRLLDSAAMQIARTLYRMYGPYAEVGIDLALQRNDNVSFFEVNPTPGRRMLRSLPGNVRQLSLAYLIEYAKSAPVSARK